MFTATQSLLYNGLGAMDLANNASKAVRGFAPIRGVMALLMALPFAAISFGLFWLVWFFDLSTTVEYTEQVTRLIVPIAPPEMLAAAGYIALSLTLLPTLFELFGSQLALRGVHLAGWLLLALLIFDGMTDMPRVNEFCTLFLPLIEANFGAGWASWAVFHVFRALWLVMATIGFELLFLVFAILTLQMLWQTGVRPISVARPAGR
jgi:uncharacterized membrane protein YhdT